MDSWATVRDSIYDSDGKVIVLLGASRMQLDINTDLLRKRYPNYTIAQLAVNGRPPMMALKDLADDPKFKGIAICSVMMMTLPPDKWKGQEEYVAHYYQFNDLNSKINRYLGSIKQNHLVIADPRIKLINIAKGLLKEKKLIDPFYVEGMSDRSCRADYSQCTETELRQFIPDEMKHGTPSDLTLGADPKQWLKDVQSVETLVQKIQSRGGKVVFVRMPTSGEIREYESLIVPRRLFWDNFVKMTSAETIHFEDVATLKNFYCPDRSHLDFRDTQQFTNSLFDEISQRDVFGTTPPLQTASEKKRTTTQ